MIGNYYLFSLFCITFMHNYAYIFLPPNIWVVSIRILNGVAGHGRCRSVVLWPNSFVNSRVKCNLTLTRVKVAARLT